MSQEKKYWKSEIELKPNIAIDHLRNNEFTEKLMNQFTKELDLNTKDYIKKGEYWYLDKIDREKFLSDVINQVTELSKMYINESANKTVSNIKMNNLDWGKSTAERNANLDKYYSLKTDKERRDFLIKLKGESVNEDEQLDEKLITFSNRAPYGQIVFMAGGAGSGKGFAINNFIDAAGFKVRDVDEMKKAVGKLDALGKISVDKWYKKYFHLLKIDKNGFDPKKHIEKHVLNKGLTISDIASDLKNPDNVASLHYIVDAMGLKDKWLINMLKGKQNKETLPNLLFDTTTKKVSAITNVIKPLVANGYDPKNIHLIWVLTNYDLAIEQNKTRDRVVPDDIMLQTHTGASETMWSILTKILPKGLNGRIDVILNNRKNTVQWRLGDNLKTQRRKNTKGDIIKGQPLKSDPEQKFVVRSFLSLPIKKQGGGIIAERNWKKRLLSWITQNAPKSIDLNKPLDEQVNQND